MVLWYRLNQIALREIVAFRERTGESYQSFYIFVRVELIAGPLPVRCHKIFEGCCFLLVLPGSRFSETCFTALGAGGTPADSSASFRCSLDTSIAFLAHRTILQPRGRAASSASSFLEISRRTRRHTLLKASITTISLKVGMPNKLSASASSLPIPSATANKSACASGEALEDSSGPRA